MNAKRFMSMAEAEARDYLESLRWPDGPACPHCGSKAVGRLQGKATRPGVFKCKARECRKQFTVTVGTIFESSHVPLSKWIAAFYMVCCSKKGVSALQLQRMLGLGSYRTAWIVAGRIRWAMRQEPLRTLLKGIVESDETWVGPVRRVGKGRNDWQKNKTAVVAMVERHGNLRPKVMRRVTKANLRKALNEAVDKGAVLMTDELKTYRKLAPAFRDHRTVNHSIGEYVNGDAHVNTCESWFALLKRGIHGTFHHVGREHLFRYADEFAFRFNHRRASDADRTEAALRTAPGKRLLYQRLRVG